MRLLKILALTVVVCCLPGCDDDDTLSGNYKVTDINILANDINVGESVRVEVFFSTKVEIDNDPDSLEVVARIPNQLQYDQGSSRIYDDSTNDTDNYEPSTVSCADGSMFLVYRFSDSDLDDRSLNGRDEFGLRLNVTGASPTREAEVRAAANKTQEFSCDEFFQGEEDEAVEVLP